MSPAGNCRVAGWNPERRWPRPWLANSWRRAISKFFPSLVSKQNCSRDSRFDARYFLRSRVAMAQHGFGRGEYKYFAYPLPRLISDLRAEIYPHLSRVASRWNEAMGIDVRYPRDHAAFLKRCHDAGQIRPTTVKSSSGSDKKIATWSENVFVFQQKWGPCWAIATRLRKCVSSRYRLASFRHSQVLRMSSMTAKPRPSKFSPTRRHG